MELTKEKAKENLSKLIKKFKEELATERAQGYNEEATKKSFIEPLLQDVLGWDVRDNNEVSPEERVSKGRVDYGLKVEGNTRIYIEAKPISADLDKHIQQAVKYGYNKKGVPFVLLTDFEGVKLFDVTVKPDSRNFLKGLKIDLQWKEYLEKFDELWLLSKDSIIKGELDKLLLVKLKDRLPVDKAILDDLKRWRVSLAKDIFKNNHELFNSGERERDAHFLKEIAQKLLDRIIFMRSCEDRDLTYRPKLKKIFEERTETVGTNTMIFLKEEFRHYNIIFNSDLFSPKEWESDLAIDFKVFQNIIFDTYNPYLFDVIPLEVLGNIYEQYLGYTVRLTDHQVKYELKPEVLRAGGVYYTPEYIVDYIVKNSVGKLIQELSDKKIKKLRILDPACGSGSFLIRAYDEILEYYKNLKKDSQKSKDKMSTLKFENKGEEPLLTIEEKNEILRKHIFGVDIDEQAVEVTKLSLMLKILEDEYGLIHGHSILPILDRNIRCGNSLISGDILELKKYFGDEWYALKPCNWEKEFEKIMVGEGGFDVVIGNPPYVFTRELIKESEKDYYNKIYKNTQFKINTYFLFVEKGYDLLKNTGTLAFIIPNNWLSLETASEFRRFILSKTYSIIVVNNRDKIFKNASVDTSILIFSKKGKREIIIFEFENCILKEIVKDEPSIYLDSENCLISYEIHKTDSYLNICSKIRSQGIDLKIISEVRNGIQAYTVGEGTPKQTEEMKNKRVYHSNKKENNSWLKYVDGVDVKRYFLGWSKQFVKYGKNLSRPRKPYLFSEERLLVRQIPAKPPYCILTSYVTETLINDNNSMIVKKKKNNYNLKYIMGILNSKLMSFWFIYTFGKLQRKVFPQFKVKELSIFPIRPINFDNTKEKNFHDKLVGLVDVMLKSNKIIQLAKGSELELIRRQIEEIDREIDGLVYNLYGITEEEKKIIEQSS